MSPSSYISLRQLISTWNEAILTPEDGEAILDRVGIAAYQLAEVAESVTASLTLAFDGVLKLYFPGIEGLAVCIGTEGESTAIATEVIIENVGNQVIFEVKIAALDIILRFPPGLLKPVHEENGQWVPDAPVNGLEPGYELTLASIALTVNQEGDIEFQNGVPQISFPPAMIGDSGIVIQADDIGFYFSRQAALPANAPAGFKGLYFETARVYLPGTLKDLIVSDAAFENCFIGSGGFTGEVVFNGSVSGTIGGFGLSVSQIGIAFVQNALTESAFHGRIQIPFFDQEVEVALRLAMDGSIGVALSESEGLLSINVPQVGSLQLTSLGFSAGSIDADLILSGILQLVVGAPLLQWPAVEVQNMRISAHGDVDIPNGWLDLQQALALDLYGFRMEISRLGFGKEQDGRRWVGFSGGLHLIDLLPAGATVEGLRILWDILGRFTPEIRLDGAGFELTIPGVLALEGDVGFFHEVTLDEDGQVIGEQRYFKGNAHLEITPISLSLDAAVKIGRDLLEDYKFFYSFLNLQLPIGLPLWATGAAIYGISGLYGMNVLPAATGNDWYRWYKAEPKFNVTHTGKWGGQSDGRAFGAGMVLGTLFDAGYAVSTKALFALLLPGPVILFNGTANILKVAPDLNDTASEGTFSMFALLDAWAGSLQLNLDAGWSVPQIIDIHAAADAYFDFGDPQKWHLYLGRDKPKTERIRAAVISLFHADSYLMLDRKGIANGFGVSYGIDWKFGPVRVVLRAFIEAGAKITWRPAQLQGSLALGGEFAVSVAGFGVGLAAEASLSGKAPTLYWVLGLLNLQVKLPAPIKDLQEDIRLEWKEQKDPLPEDPFESSALEHPKVDETWMLADSAAQLDPVDAHYAPGPLVPLDARPAIVFDRSVKDETTGIDLSSPNVYAGATRVGEHEFDYLVKDIALYKWSKAGGTAWQPVTNLYGAWMAIEDESGEPAARKLEIWTKSPFEFTRRSGRTYRDAFLANHPNWPCAEMPEVELHCLDWEEAPLDTNHGPVFERDGLTFILETYGSIAPLRMAECNTQKALDLIGNDIAWILFPEPVRLVRLCLAGSIKSVAAYGNGISLTSIENPAGEVVLYAAGIDSIQIESGRENSYLGKICFEPQANAESIQSTVQHITRLVAGLTHWASEDEILEPETWYRLTVKLETVRTHKGLASGTPYTHHAYFQTAAPPGLKLPWSSSDVDGSTEAPVDGDSLNEKPYPDGGQLIDLSQYVRWSIPADGAVAIYRAFDLGAEFNENYVEQMYGADMAIKILDANGNSLMEEEGIYYLNHWAKAPTAELSGTETAYLTRVKDCLSLPGFSLPADHVFVASSGVLLEEDFSGSLERWQDVDAPDGDPGDNWVVLDGMLRYDGAVFPVLGALLVAGENEWADYAVEVALSAQGEDVGIVFRYSEAEARSYYRLRLNTSGRYLERISGSDVTSLWADPLPYIPGEVEMLAIQCRGNRLRGQMDAQLLFDLHDDEGYLSGKVGIYANSTAAFEHFLVRAWPGGVLAPQSMYSAELQASSVLFQGGLNNGWTDSGFSWTELSRDNNHLAIIGREAWQDYRLGVNVDVTINRGHVGAILRFSRATDTFTCYRLIFNQDESQLQLARLNGTISGNTYEIADEGRKVLWSCSGTGCGVDFGLDEHTLAFSCIGPDLIIELDGQQLASIEDPNPLLSGQAGLYYQGKDTPDFSELVIRSAPRKPVYRWSFITSRFEGLVEHLDTFTGDIYTEEIAGLDAGQLALAVAEAATALDRTTQVLASARRALAKARADEVGPLRLETQQAALERNVESASQFDALYELLLGSCYRPRPPVVEISEIASPLQRHALLLECPEPLDWSRLTARLSRQSPSNGRFEDVQDDLCVWNEDGTKALFISTGSAALRAGQYRLHFDYQLDLGAEAPVLRRSGSTLPEVAALSFTLAKVFEPSIPPPG